MSAVRGDDRALLLRVARGAMQAQGLEPDFPPAAIAEAQALKLDGDPRDATLRDLRALPWCSIDNDDSRDLDQLTVAEALNGSRRFLVAVADVSAAVRPGSSLDAHANTNTTSVYTPAQIFPMLPERLSTDLTSLNAGVDRRAMVVEITVNEAGSSSGSSIYPALVRNHAKLAYNGVGAWLEGKGAAPPAIAAVPGLDENLRLQDRIAQQLKADRHLHGALELETLEVRAQFDGDSVSRLVSEPPNRAKQLIEDFMIAANGAMASFLAARGSALLRRVVRSPERWQRIVEIARALGGALPATPDAAALHAFLLQRRVADPLRFPDLSLTVIKLMGRGEYVASFPGDDVSGHFGLAVSEYTHSTAPNRRYADLITQRLIKSVLSGGPPAYGRAELEALAINCTVKQDSAQKVERLVRKAAAACMLADRVGQAFDGIVTGASVKGTWVRIFDPPVEGRVERGAAGLDVGDVVRVKLLSTDPQRGFIDFASLGPARAAGR